MGTPTGALEIARQVLTDLDQHASDSFPEECCGILFGRFGDAHQEPIFRVSALWPAQNAESGDRQGGYCIAPEELLRAHKQARSRGEDVIGYYHSHPGSSARPSARDLAEALPGVSYLIVAVQDRQIVERRSWRLRSDLSGFDEERLL